MRSIVTSEGRVDIVEISECRTSMVSAASSKSAIVAKSDNARRGPVYALHEIFEFWDSETVYLAF